MLVKVWEVYPENGYRTVLFRTEELAKNQNMVYPVDFIAESEVDLSEEEIEILNSDKGLWE